MVVFSVLLENNLIAGYTLHSYFSAESNTI